MQNFFEYYKDSGLGKWLDEKWVDISRKDKSGKHPPCGASAKKAQERKIKKKLILNVALPQKQQP